MSSSNDELRRMLDERGVEYQQTVVTKGTLFTVSTDKEHYFILVRDCDAGFEMWSQYFTPEQAIAATLGPGTCMQEQGGWSTEGDHARVWLTCGHDCMVETVADLPKFCPECGARLEGE